jgi:hypothetical protein
MMGIIKKICSKISGKDKLQEEYYRLQKQLKDRDMILKRIKIIATSNHYGYSKEDKEYREKNCINVKLRKIFELAQTFDENDDLDFWDKLDELEDEK